MVTTVGTESDVRTLIRDLIMLDYDAIAAYEAAIERLDDTGIKKALSSFRDDHVRHTQNLAPFLRDLGEPVPDAGDAKEMLTTGKVKMASLAGDKAVLKAMRTNEDDTNTAYARAVEHADATPSMREVLNQNLSDERRHCDWILETLGRM